MPIRTTFCHPLAALLVIASCAHADDYHVYFLAGQSNMDGYGMVSELPATLHNEVPGVRIFLGQVKNDAQPATGAGLWTAMTPGLGSGARTDGVTLTPGDRFGPELTFAARIRELRPTEKIAIIKYAKGGSSLDDRVAGWGTWDPHDARTDGINQYDHALATIDAAMRTQDIDGDGEPDRLMPAGILWMQGETDATNAQTSNDYEHNLREITELFRAALRRDDLPMVIGRISDSKASQPAEERVWQFGDVVRTAQQQVADADPHAALVTSTDGYGYSDAAHYDTAGYIDLGRQFAEAMNALRTSDNR